MMYMFWYFLAKNNLADFFTWIRIKIHLPLIKSIAYFLGPFFAP